MQIGGSTSEDYPICWARIVVNGPRDVNMIFVCFTYETKRFWQRLKFDAHSMPVPLRTATERLHSREKRKTA